MLVVDVDVKGGVDGFAQLEPWDFPPTLEVHTPSGGRHLFYKHPGADVALSNRKLDTAIDVRAGAVNEGGHAYVIGPGSPGYLKVEGDPCRVTPAEPYEIAEDLPIADAPELLISWLTLGAERGKFTPKAIDESSPHWANRLAKGVEAAKTMPPSVADGQGGQRLFNLALRLVRTLELPPDVAHELVAEHFNPRCTQADGVTHFPWDDADIQHKIDDARTKSDLPCGLAEGIASKMREHARKPNATPRAPEVTDERTKIGAGFTNDGDRSKLSRTAVAEMLYRWPDWKDVLWYDVLKRRPFAVKPPLVGALTLEQGQMSKGDLAQIALWFDANGFLVSKEQIEDGLWNVVRMPDRQVNAIAKYLDGLTPVTEAKHLPTLATDVLGCTDPFANELVMKTLIAAARRGRSPGHRHRAMLVLKGDQYCGKTAFVKILAGGFYHSTGNGNLADRDTILECQGSLFVEVEELSALSKADENALKTAISREVDVITKKYEPDGQSYPRSFVLIGTTNKDEFLTDSTGNTRYWVVEVGQVDLARLAELRDVLWAEADFLAQTTSADSNEMKSADDQRTLAEGNAGYLLVHPWIERVRKFLVGKSEVRTTEEVLEHLLNGDMTKADKRAKNEVAEVLRFLGCVYTRRREAGKIIRMWRIPAELSTKEPAGKVVSLSDRLRPRQKK